MKEEKEDILYLQPKSSLNIAGKLSYKESLQSWCVIQLKKEIITLFPQLKEKRSSFGYRMYYNSSFKETREMFRKLEKEGNTPILLLLGRAKD